MRGWGRGLRLIPVLAGAIVVIVLLGAALAIRQGDMRRADSASERFEPAPLTTPLPLRRVAVFGDSYAVGTGASTPEQGFVRRLAVLERWQIDDESHGGTGYATAGTTGVAGCDTDSCPTFGGALADAPEEAPDAVLVFGGRNDVGRSIAALQKAIPAFYDALCTKYPDADVYAVSPVWDSRTPPAQLAVIQGLVRSAVSSCSNGTYVDIGEPLERNSGLIVSDGVHPNDQGHAVLTRAIVRALDGAR